MTRSAKAALVGAGVAAIVSCSELGFELSAFGQNLMAIHPWIEWCLMNTARLVVIPVGAVHYGIWRLGIAPPFYEVSTGLRIGELLAVNALLGAGAGWTGIAGFAWLKRWRAKRVEAVQLVDG